MAPRLPAGDRRHGGTPDAGRGTADDGAERAIETQGCAPNTGLKRADGADEPRVAHAPQRRDRLLRGDAARVARAARQCPLPGIRPPHLRERRPAAEIVGGRPWPSPRHDRPDGRPRRGKRERLVAAALVREAWRAATGRCGARLLRSDATCNTCDIVSSGARRCRRSSISCARRWRHAGQGAPCRLCGRRRAGSAGLRSVQATGPIPHSRSRGRFRAHAGPASDLAGGNLGVILARLLLEMQGATLSCTQARTAAGSAADRVSRPG